MIKRNTYFLMMWVAFSVLFGHSVIGHHHHEDTHQTASHHHHDENENQDLSDLFSNFHHGNDGFQFAQHSDNLIEKGKNATFTPLLVPDLLSKQYIHFLLEDKVVKPPDIFSNRYSTQILNYSGLRGPPIFIV